MFTKKKIITFILLLAVAAPLLFSSGFLINKEWLQYKANERLQQGQLLNITTDISNITWIKKDKEVIVNNKLFDVKSAAIHGNEITLTGFFDEDEDKLNKSIKDLLKQNDEGSCMEDDQLTEFFSFPINTHSVDFNVNTDWQYIARLYGKFAENIPNSPRLPYILPPKLS